MLLEIEFDITVTKTAELPRVLVVEVYKHEASGSEAQVGARLASRMFSK